MRREVAPHLRTGRTPARCRASCTAKAAKQGLLGVSFPEEVGGEGGDLLDSIAVMEAMFEAGASSGLMAALFTGGIALPHLAATGNADLVDRFVRPTLAGELIGSLAVTEPGGGSDVAAIRTTARRDGDHYVVDGTKTFITSGVRADFVTTAVRTGGPGPRRASSLLVVEKGTPGFTVDRALAKMGWHCSDTAELGFADVPGAGAATWSARRTPASPRSPSSSWSSGSRWRCTATASPPAASPSPRRTAASGRPSAGRWWPTRWCATRWSRCGGRSRSRGPTPTRWPRRHVAGEDVVAEACLAKQTAVDCATYVCDQAVQLHGGTGYLHGTEVERHYRDARILPIGGGATEVLTDLAARLMGYAVMLPPLGLILRAADAARCRSTWTRRRRRSGSWSAT